MVISRNQKRRRRHARVRARISGTPTRPRISVYRSLTDIKVQVIDDTTGRTLCAASLADVPAKERANTVAGAAALGGIVAAKCIAAKITQAVFDRGGYKYHGKIKALADGIREGGIVM